MSIYIFDHSCCFIWNRKSFFEDFAIKLHKNLNKTQLFEVILYFFFIPLYKFI